MSGSIGQELIVLTRLAQMKLCFVLRQQNIFSLKYDYVWLLDTVSLT